MQVTVNGNSRQIEQTNVIGLLERFNIKNQMTIVEINKSVVSKDKWETTHLNDGDTIEIIQLMGGG